ncbi:AAA family ATPase, partial [archaeon]|nr:AAA family ATPase [archaeon]
WILQAGALVLANKGVIAIDEFDKMNEDDQVAMHEAMSVSTISIAKASIVATLPADTAVLAGANPKLGRFDAFRPVSEQIHIPETLLSRFDLKFALKDKPNVETDARIAQHILDIRDSPDVAEPIIEPMLLRKYIAYARKIEKVTMTKEAGKVLKDFYNDMRNKYSGEAGHSVAITLRQFEAMIRISEASAKVRLKKQVDIEDAERAINLMKYSLVQLGTDAETGEIDIDRIESGVSTSQRNKIKEVMEMIRTLQKDVGKVVSVQDLKAEAEEQGIGNIDDLLEKLKQEGMVFVPRVGYISTV